MKYLILFLFLCASYLSYSKDSLTVFIWGIKKGEKYKVVVQGKIQGIYFCNSKSKTCSFEFKIYSGQYSNEEPMQIDVYRKSRFSFQYKSTLFSAFYNTNKKYLLIKRDNKLKDRYAVKSVWEDLPPAYR